MKERYLLDLTIQISTGWCYSAVW